MSNEFSIPAQLPGWLMMPADEFKLALRHMSVLETEAIKISCKLKLHCFTCGMSFYWILVDLF